jgi:F0F1-type ATP synthase membrane subunit c/vacuolar-type H+-ATPase subunit K
MRLAPVLLSLYPRPVRARWGPDLEAEIRDAGWWSLPDTLAGIAGLWLHPVVWPGASPRRRRLRMTTMAVAVALACWFASLATAELGGRSAQAAGRSPLMSAGMVLILAGLVLLAPFPVFRALAATCRIAVSRLAVPALLGAGAVVAVHAGAASEPHVVRTAVLSCWWTALALGAVQACRAIAAAGPRVIPPRAGRLRAGTALLTAGAAANATALLGFSLNADPDPAATVTGLGLLASLTALVLVIRDTRHLPARE